VSPDILVFALCQRQRGNFTRIVIFYYYLPWGSKVEVDVKISFMELDIQARQMNDRRYKSFVARQPYFFLFAKSRKKVLKLIIIITGIIITQIFLVFPKYAQFLSIDIPLLPFLTPVTNDTWVVGTRYQRVLSALHMPPDISFPIPQNGPQTWNPQGIISTVRPVSEEKKAQIIQQ
jgi:hypothetical protein